MQPLPASALAAAPSLNELIERLTDEPTGGLPVVDEEGAYRARSASQQIEQAMRENALDASAGELAKRLPALTDAPEPRGRARGAPARRARACRLSAARERSRSAG